MTINPAWISAAVAIVAVGATLFGVARALGARDQTINSQGDLIKGLRETAKVLFEKLDKINSELQGYKLHVAETYVNRGALDEALKPINKQLEQIQDDVRRLRETGERG